MQVALPFTSLFGMPGVALCPILASRLRDISAAQLYFHDLVGDLPCNGNTLLVDGIFPCYIYGFMCNSKLMFYNIFCAIFRFLSRLILYFTKSQYFGLMHLYYCDLFMSTILASCVPHENVHILSYLVSMQAMRHTMLRHVFFACIMSFSSMCIKLSSKLKQCLCDVKPTAAQVQILYHFQTFLPLCFSLRWHFLFLDLCLFCQLQGILSVIDITLGH